MKQTLGADQKECGLWERDWHLLKMYVEKSDLKCHKKKCSEILLVNTKLSASFYAIIFRKTVCGHSNANKDEY